MKRRRSSSIATLLRRLEAEQAKVEGAPSPEEIEERAAAVRAEWSDADGVLRGATIAQREKALARERVERVTG